MSTTSLGAGQFDFNFLLFIFVAATLFITYWASRNPILPVSSMLLDMVSVVFKMVWLFREFYERGIFWELPAWWL